MHLGTLRRLTGTIKAKAVAEAVREEFEAGLDKIVLMAWHKDTMAVLRKELRALALSGLTGRQARQTARPPCAPSTAAPGCSSARSRQQAKPSTSLPRPT
jgi:hypothetical protein